MEKSLKLCEVHSFSTSPNLRHHTTMLNTYVRVQGVKYSIENFFYRHRRGHEQLAD